MPTPSRQSDPMAANAAQTRDPAVIAISATFTAEALEPTLAFWLRELQLDFQVRFAPYNQVFQQLLDPAGLLLNNRNGLNVVLVRFEDWARFRDAVSIAELEENVRNLESALRSAPQPPVRRCWCAYARLLRNFCAMPRAPGSSRGRRNRLGGLSAI